MKCFGLLLAFLTATSVMAEDAVQPSVATRFAGADGSETPDFQRHVVPLLGKLGCNGRACHGSFQGRGGFRLSLFGYDFKADHEELQGRLDPETPAESLMLQKPLMETPHEGGQRLQSASWQHHLLLNWVKNKAPARPADAAKLLRLQVTPSHIDFDADDQQVQLRAVAVWEDGTQEDVTDLCRFQSNDDQIADITEGGLVQAGVPGDTHVVAFYDSAVVPIAVIRPVSDRTGDNYPATPTPTEVDRLVVSKLKKLGVVQSDLCSDEEFLRRASLDVTGALPTPAEIQAFLADTSPDKRSQKIDELLERPGYVAWWTTRLCDFTGNSDDQLNNVTPIRSEASRQWYDFIHARIASNMAYDDIVEGLVMAVSREPGESFEEYCRNMSRLYHKDSDYTYDQRSTMPHYWARRNFQQTEDRVIGFAYSFLGLRIQCAQCHKHPFDQWTQDDFKGFEGFFTGVNGRNQAPRPDAREEYNKLLATIETGGLKGNQLRNEFGKLLRQGEIVPFGEVYATPPAKAEPKRKGKNQRANRNGSRTAKEGKLLGEDAIDLTEYEDVREPLMAWLRSPDNPMFAKAFVNRVWANYFNMGIVNPVDDLNLANPPTNAPLLDYLSQQFIAHDFDMKWLHREILNSRTYQLSWRPNDTNRLDERNFARAVPRRLPAEIAWDMISQAVSNDRKYADYVTSTKNRAVAIPGSGTRYQGNNNDAGYALTIFGRSIRESNCDCDRSEEPSLLQTIFLRNDGQVLSMLDSRDGWLAQVATENGVRFQAKAPTQDDRAEQQKQERLRATYQARLKDQQNALKKLKQKEGTEKQVQRLQVQIDNMKKKWKSMLKEGGDAEAHDDSGVDSKSTEFKVVKAVEDAYLRTLSRLPTAQEAADSKAFVAQAKTPLDGLRDVMWALLNTKEFIVNH